MSHRMTKKIIISIKYLCYRNQVAIVPCRFHQPERLAPGKQRANHSCSKPKHRYSCCLVNLKVIKTEKYDRG